MIFEANMFSSSQHQKYSIALRLQMGAMYQIDMAELIDIITIVTSTVLVILASIIARSTRVLVTILVCIHIATKRSFCLDLKFYHRLNIVTSVTRVNVYNLALPRPP